MRGTGLLTRVVLGLFSHDCQHTLLYEPSAGHSCLLIHHLADHLARKGIVIQRLPLFNLCLLTQPSMAQELLQGTQPLRLIKLGHLDEPLESQSLSQDCPGHQQRPGGRGEPSELRANQLTHARWDQLAHRDLREQPGPQHQPPGAILLKRRNNDLALQQAFEGLHQVQRLPLRLKIEPVGEGHQRLSQCGGFPLLAASLRCAMVVPHLDWLLGPRKLLHEAPRFFLCESGEQERGQRNARPLEGHHPGGLHAGEALGSRAHAQQQQDRCALVGQAPCQVEQQVERRCIRPLHVIEEENQGTPRGPGLDETGCGLEQARVPELFIGRGNGQFGMAVAQFGQQAGEFGQPDITQEITRGRFLLQVQAQNIDEWLIRQLSPGLQSSPHQYVGPLRLCPAEKFAGQARFADPGFSLEQDQLRLSRLRALVTLDQGAELGCSSQERAVQQVRRRLSW